MYSYSFMPYRWSRSHASQAELQEYVERVIDHYGMRKHFVFNCGISSVTWSERRRSYTVAMSSGDEREFDAVVSCLGMLSNPNMPTWPGMSDYQGIMFHSSRYRHDVDLTGLRVAVVGTGSTACQLAPMIAPVVGHLDLYQREPGWVLPKSVVPVPDEVNREYDRRPALWRMRRYRAFYRTYRTRGVYNSTTKAHANAQRLALETIERSVHDPALREALTPTYPFGCKRPVFAAGYYEMFNRPNVDLIPRAVTSMTLTGLVDADGVERPADVVILATGFQATRYQSTLDVHGVDGLSLRDVWGPEPRAFMGITVPAFPNFFMLYGPNTNGAMSIIATLERQAEAVSRAARWLRRYPSRVIDTSPRAADLYDAWIQRNMVARDVERSGCHNYFHASTGKNVTQLPMSAPMYLTVTRLLPWFGWQRRRPRVGKAGERLPV
jgi:cation diffusion facilitator CzcD-associated flavoprotein CzcO